jgi:subfamily B ATP-binding cassette protein MsbA
LSARADLPKVAGLAIYRRLMAYARPYWRMFGLSIVGMVVYAATEPAFAAMMKPLLDGTFIERDMDTVRLMPMLLIALMAVRGVAGFVNHYCLSWVGRRVVADLRQAMFDHLLRTPTRYYDNHG